MPPIAVIYASHLKQLPRKRLRRFRRWRFEREVKTFVQYKVKRGWATAEEAIPM